MARERIVGGSSVSNEGEMPRERIVGGSPISEDEESFNWSLRPETIDEFIGQTQVVEKLGISIEAAKGREEPLEHTLFYGPPGLGKTTLAHVIAREMEAKIHITSGPTLGRTGDLMGILTNLKQGDVLFIDEVHRLPINIEEFLYPAIEDFKVDFIIDKGAFAKSLNFKLQPFTLIGATTRAGFLSAPFRERFGIFHHLDFYPESELGSIVRRSAGKLSVEIAADAVGEVSGRSRGTPRIANRLLRRVRDYAQVKADGKVTREVAVKALDMEGVDDKGLDELDRKYLRVITDYYDGGPVGIEALGATLNEEVDTLEDMVEPYLLKIGFLSRTRNGRRVSHRAYDHLGLDGPNKGKTEGTLF
ncbi:Holliday junction branch migration DNA helicase RuvB [candidate division KSB1 bacterium]